MIIQVVTNKINHLAKMIKKTFTEVRALIQEIFLKKIISITMIINITRDKILVKI